MPLEESPRPKQIWRRGRDLQGKKIISYEEGGSNGLLDSESRSTVALVLASSANLQGEPVEVWCLSVSGGLKPLCLSTDALGGAFFNQNSFGSDAFEPFVVILSGTSLGDDRLDISLDMYRLIIDQDEEIFLIEETAATAQFSCSKDDRTSAPTMAMGTSPMCFCLSHRNAIIAIVRDEGLFVVYRYADGKLNLVDKIRHNRYVVDAAIKDQDEADGVDIVALLCDNDNVKDGRIVTITVNV